MKGLLNPNSSEVRFYFCLIFVSVALTTIEMFQIGYLAVVFYLRERF